MKVLVTGENVPQRQLFAIVGEIAGRGMPRRLPFPVASAIGAVEREGIQRTLEALES